MRTEQIYYCLEAAQTGSFTRAAQNLYLNPPSLRAGIIALEEELGYKIFDRHANGVTLTSNGQKILPKLYEIIQIYECLKIPLADDSTNIVEFRISLPPNQYDEYIITKSMDFLHRINPLLRIKFLNSVDALEQIRMLLREEIDIAQTTVAMVQLKNESYLYSQLDRSWVLEPVKKETIIPVAAEKHPLVQKNNCYTIEDLQPYTLILNSLGNKALSHLLHSYSPQSKFDIVYLSSSRREFADYLDYNAIYFCPESLLHLDDYAKLVPVKLEKEIVFENCLAYRLNDDNPLLPSYAEFLRSLLKQKFF